MKLKEPKEEMGSTTCVCFFIVPWRFNQGIALKTSRERCFASVETYQRLQAGVYVLQVYPREITCNDLVGPRGDVTPVMSKLEKVLPPLVLVEIRAELWPWRRFYYLSAPLNVP